jgi:hypothetical protein
MAIAVVNTLSAISRCASVTIGLTSAPCSDDPEGVDILGCACTGIANKRIVRVLPVSFDQLRASVDIFFMEFAPVAGSNLGLSWFLPGLDTDRLQRDRPLLVAGFSCAMRVSV